MKHKTEGEIIRPVTTVFGMNRTRDINYKTNNHPAQKIKLFK